MKSTKQLHQSIIEQCKNNNAKAQMQLYNLYSKAMFLVALRYVKDKFIAEDVMQDALIKGFKNIHKYNNEVAFGAWLKRIVINQSIDEIKKKNDDMMLDLSEYLLTISSLQYVDWSKARSNLFENIYSSFSPKSSLNKPKFDLSTAYKHKT